MAKKKATHISTDLNELVEYLRGLDKKNFVIYAHNGTGKTRLSMAFKDKGKEGGEEHRDTLYFNAFTEDLFSWDNDLENDTNRGLKFNANSHFFDGLDGADMENKIRPFLHRYVDFDFSIDYEGARVSFWRRISSHIDASNEGDKEESILVTEDGIPIVVDDRVENIKVSRGEENIFIWCFFLAIAEMAIDKHENYQWVKYLYIDDPISSLDDTNAVAVAAHLRQLLEREDNKLKTIISTHHGLFFNVMYNELSKAEKYFLNKLKTKDGYSLIDTKDTPFFHHAVLVQILQKAINSGELYTYHFNMLRNVLEKTAAFHGYSHFGACIKQDDDDNEGVIHARKVNILSHGNYSLFDPIEMQEENKNHFKSIFEGFVSTHKFNDKLFQELEKGEETI